MNEEKMIEVLAQVEDEREAFAARKPGAVGFNMGSWHGASITYVDGAPYCGTTACLAGHAAIADGWELKTSTLCSHSKTGKMQDIEDVGREALGLSTNAACSLFYLDSLDEVYEWVAEYMGVDETVLRDKVTAARR